MSSTTLSRPRPSATREPRASVVVSGLAGAASVAALSWAAIVGLVVVGWASAGSTASVSATTRIGSYLWLLCHGVPLDVPGGTVSLVPLGLTALAALLLYRAGRVAARAYGAATVADCVRVALAVAGPYATAAVVVAGAARTADVQPSLWQAALWPGLLAAIAAGFAALRQAGVVRSLAERVPLPARLVLRTSAWILTAWLIAAAALLLTATAFGAGRVSGVITSLHTGAVGAALIALGSVLLLPNALVWTGGYGLGGGVAVGDAAVSPFGMTPGELPSLPPLAVLPQTAPMAALRAVVLVFPLLAGWFLWRLERHAFRMGEPWWHSGARMLGVCLTVALGVGGLSAAAGGALGTVTMGPRPLLDAATAAAAVGATGLVAAAMNAWRRKEPRVDAALQALRRRVVAARGAVGRRFPV